MLISLAAEANCWSKLVINRVAKIQGSDFLKWSHVGTHDNPADIASRGSDPSKLKNCSLWWSDHQWLTTENFSNRFSRKAQVKKKNCVLGQFERTFAAKFQEPKDHSGDVTNFREQNSFLKTLRIVVQIRPFNDNCKQERKL